MTIMKQLANQATWSWQYNNAGLVSDNALYVVLQNPQFTLPGSIPNLAMCTCKQVAQVTHTASCYVYAAALEVLTDPVK